MSVGGWVGRDKMITADVDRDSVRAGVRSQEPRRADLRQLYARFDPVKYHRMYYTDMDPEVQFFLRQLHRVFSKEVVGPGGGDVLEVGCGPTITSVLSASGWAGSITMADFVPANRRCVSAWLAGAAGCLDWSPYLQYVSSLEGSGLTPGQLARRVRSRVAAVLPVDVLSSHPLTPSGKRRSADVPTRYDVVVSSLCLEFAAADIRQFNAAVRNVASLVKCNGHLVLQGALENTYYLVEGVRYPSVPLTRERITHALSAAGLTEKRWQHLPRQCPNSKAADHSGCFFVVATKLGQ